MYVSWNWSAQQTERTDEPKETKRKSLFTVSRSKPNSLGISDRILSFELTIVNIANEWTVIKIKALSR